MRYDRGLIWFRRDLRADDNAALYHALTTCRQVFALFVFDRAILATLPRADRRVEFIRDSVVALREELLQWSQGRAHLIVEHAHAERAVPAVSEALGVEAVFANHDDEPYAQSRDRQVRDALAQAGIAFFTSKDHVIFERQELLTQGGTPFTVFTPYKNAWLKKVNNYYLKSYPNRQYIAQLADHSSAAVPSLQELGFEGTNLRDLGVVGGCVGAQKLLDDFLQRMPAYAAARDFPSIKGPSYLSVHLRFGTVSVRRLARMAFAAHCAGDQGASTWLGELIWRDFYAQIMANFPHCVEQSFKPAYDQIAWEKGKEATELFSAWCDGRTGYPLVDAAMAQINQTGYMHNRLRMVVASFLTKDLGVDWRWGERYFAEKLIDFDLSANNGGWQWAASSGCDAQPYFRIFNPVSQSERFDAQGKFIRRYLPQLAGLSEKAIHAPWLASPIELRAAGVELGRNYPAPIVSHDAARLRTLDRYSVVKVKA